MDNAPNYIVGYILNPKEISPYKFPYQPPSVPQLHHVSLDSDVKQKFHICRTNLVNPLGPDESGLISKVQIL